MMQVAFFQNVDQTVLLVIAIVVFAFALGGIFGNSFSWRRGERVVVEDNPPITNATPREKNPRKREKEREREKKLSEEEEERKKKLAEEDARDIAELNRATAIIEKWKMKAKAPETS